jgi:hypothetical protein
MRCQNFSVPSDASSLPNHCKDTLKFRIQRSKQTQSSIGDGGPITYIATRNHAMLPGKVHEKPPASQSAVCSSVFCAPFSLNKTNRTLQRHLSPQHAISPVRLLKQILPITSFPLSRINRHLLKQIHRPNPPLLRKPESTRLR